MLLAILLFWLDLDYNILYYYYGVVLCCVVLCCVVLCVRSFVRVEKVERSVEAFRKCPHAWRACALEAVLLI